ncbi:MAG: hypothetical protein AAFY41_02015, partial [Bacteroidota bacterium]
HQQSYFKKLPRHIGYEQLCIIRHKQKKFDEVIALSKRAHNEGWNGEWHGRMKRAIKAKSKM